LLLFPPAIIATSMVTLRFVAAAAGCLSVAGAAVLPPAQLKHMLERRQVSVDPANFEWVKKWSAVGDSYTAGIGAGSADYHGIAQTLAEGGCSRYDQAYPRQIGDYFGLPKLNFQACSGAISADVFTQVNALPTGQDLVLLTVGGNDLCLSELIAKCVIVSFYESSEATCEAALTKATDNLNTFVEANIRQVLMALDGKMAGNGIVVLSGYARFFATKSDKCETDESFGVGPWMEALSTLPLTIARRTRYNKLTTDLNEALKRAVSDVEDDIGYNIGFSDWDPWVDQGVDGQMCSEKSTGAYPDENQPDLLFFKPDSRKSIFRSWVPIAQRGVDIHARESDNTTELAPLPAIDPVEELRARVPGLTQEQAERVLTEADLGRRAKAPGEVDMYGVDRSIYRTRLWQSVNPRAAALHKLDPRAPLPPGCDPPGSWIPKFPDWIGNAWAQVTDPLHRLFHPNTKGHHAMASFAVAKITEMRRQVLNQDVELCELTADFKCYSNTGRRGYATASVLDANYKKFCREVNMGGRPSASRTFNIGTPEENVFRITRNTVSLFDRDACLEAFGSIIPGCVPGLSNPMNHKFGGHLKQDGILYEVNVTPTTRPWPPPVAPYGACQAGSNFHAGSFFEFKGAGWATWDHGQESLLPALQRCLSGGRIASWNFEYFDQPDKDGYEWRVDFAVQARMQHLEMCGTEKYLVAAAGGLTGSCSGVSRKFA
jgi:lysophospholipase L1-like esterase